MKTGKEKKIEDQGTRRRIVEAATAEFAEFGLAGARVDRIALAAGANKAMIYYHFGSKKELYLKTIEEHLTAVISSLKLKIGADETLEDRLTAIATTYSSFMSGNPMIRRIFLRELASPDGTMITRIADLVRDSEVPKQFAKLLKEGHESGRLKKIDNRHAMASFISMNIGFFLLFPIFSRVLGLEEGSRMNKKHEETVVEIFLNGVKI